MLACSRLEIRHGPPDTSNSYCHPGRAGGLPLTLVEDVELFHYETPAFFADKELYILRNLRKGHGVGFFEARNFHPDFILWLI